MQTSSMWMRPVREPLRLPTAEREALMAAAMGAFFSGNAFAQAANTIGGQVGTMAQEAATAGGNLGSMAMYVAALICLTAGQVVSYIKARADSVDLRITGALAERAERNVLGLVGTSPQGIGVPYALAVCLWILAAASVFTVVQRIVQVRRAYVRREAAQPR